MDFESVGVEANDKGPEILMNLNDDLRMTEGTEVPSTETALGSWTRLSLENQYVYKFEMEASQGDYVRKSFLGGFHPYAPLQPHGTVDTDHDAYYVKVPKGFLRSNFINQFLIFSIKKTKVELQHKEDIYVSLRYLQALVENNVAWNPIQVVDLNTKREEFCKLDGDIWKKRGEWLSNKGKNKTKNVAKAAKAEMDQLIDNGKNAHIPAIATKVKVKAVSPGFDFSERCGKTSIPANNTAEDLGIYGVKGDTEVKALQRCLEEMHNLSSCKEWLAEGKDKANKSHIEQCQTLSIFVKAVIPFRNKSGKLCFGCYSPFPAGIKNDLQKNMQWLWNKYWASPGVHEQPPSPKSRGWRTRYDASPLSKPLIIWILPGARTRFYKTLNNGFVEGHKRSDLKGDAREVFGKIISHINEREKRDASRKHTKLELAPEKWEWESSRHYCLLSEDPFRLYQTYIHRDCIHEYMQSLEGVVAQADAKKAEDITPQNDGTMNIESSGAQKVVPETDKETKVLKSVRQLPIRLDQKDTNTDDVNKEKEYEAMKKKEYEAMKKSFAEYWPTDLNDTPIEKSDDEDEDEGEAEYYSDEEESNPLVEGQKVVTTKTLTQKLDEEDTKPIETKSKSTKEGEKEAEKAEPKKGMTRSIHVNPINAQKVIRAGGSRKGQKDQKAVMGFSASYFADKVLGWSWRPGPKATLKDRQMSNGLYIAEWLHLSAYSWGGIEQGTDAAAQKSSQIKKNLVFGTSEANSCMTRYEKAWQQLFKDEKLLRDRLADEQVKEGMAIDIEKYGKGDDKRTYLQGELSVVCNTKHGPYLFDEIDKYTNKYVWKERRPIEEDSKLANLAEEFPFLAYNIRYEIRLMGQSRILAPLGSSRGVMAGKDYEPPTILHMKAMFYPFSRRFYHRSEHLLDSALYQHMFMLGALDRFNGDRALAEEVFGERFKKEKLNDYKFWRKLSKTNTEFPSPAEARRGLDALRQKGPDLTKEETKDLQDAEMRYRKVFIAKANNMENSIGRKGPSIKLLTEEKKQVTSRLKKSTNGSNFKDQVVPDKVMKLS
ncbi:hypothetical protein FPRO06_09927 [Fusarium proliferatum]|nr:hypothetical protein FPRO06_09927 [Fusarium proliferatum]